LSGGEEDGQNKQPLVYANLEEAKGVEVVEADTFNEPSQNTKVNKEPAGNKFGEMSENQAPTFQSSIQSTAAHSPQQKVPQG